MNIGEAKKLMQLTKNSYDTIAEEFSRTRAKFWEELAYLAEHATPGERILDIGCGNGRFYPLLSKRSVDYVGLDYSAKLLEEARKAHPGIRFEEGDATALPFPDGSFDTAFSFATIHHIPGKALRAQFMKEAARVLKPGSRFILSTWNVGWTKKYIPFLLRDLVKIIFRVSPLELGDVILTFGTERKKRYVHRFTERELRALFEQNGFIVLDMDISHRRSSEKNLVVIAKKH